MTAQPFVDQHAKEYNQSINRYLDGWQLKDVVE
jgi:hypothetical protein